MARCIRIPLGPFEKYFILRARRDTAFAVSSYWELDRPPDPARLRRALEALRPLCPVFFSTLAVDETDPLQLVAVCDPDRPIDDFLSVHDTWTGAPGEFFRRKVLPAPDPWAEGLFRLLAVTGPIPLLGFHIPHTIADGFTANAFQQLFVELYTEGPAWRGSPPRADFAGTRMPIQWLRRTFKPGLLNEPALKPHATRPLSLSLPAGISPTDIEVRVVRHSLSTREFAGVFDR
ncbi:MAG: hypothetical protein HY343_05885, partial [Lentisphaerae bacterium]|nr:hypothetical protein [Lentisphaerota bacterium]